MRYRFASPSPTSASAATTASRSNAPLRRFRRCSPVRRRPRAGAPWAACAGPAISMPPPPARFTRLVRSGGHEPTSTGGEAAAAGASVTATTATAARGGSATVPTAAACSAPRRHGDRPARRGVRRHPCSGRRPGTTRSRPADRLPGRAAPGRARCTARPARTARAAAGRPRRTVPAAAGAGGTSGRPSGSGAADGADPLRPASRSRSTSVAMSSRRKATSSRTTATRTTTESSHAPIRRAAAWAAPLGDAPARVHTGHTGRRSHWPGRCPPPTPDSPDRPHQRGEFRADGLVVDPGDRPPCSVRATDGTPVTDNCATAESSSARSCAAGGSGRPVRRRAAPARSASTTATVPAANPATGRDFPSPQACDSRTRTIPPFVSIMIWSQSSRSSSGSERFAASASSATPISKT